MSKVSLERKLEMDLVAKAKQNPDEFGPLFKHYYPHIRRFFAVKLSSEDLVEDLTSITFEKALKNINKFEWRGYSFSSWLYRIATNSLTDYFRKNKESKKVQLENLPMESKERGPEELVELDADKQVIHKVMQTLPARERKIIYMKFFDGDTNKKIADASDLSQSNVSTIVYRALAKMRTLLEREGV